jgi:DDE superfamily endonuclease
MAEKFQFVLYYYKTYPTFDVLGTQCAMARSKAHENLHKLSPILYDTLVHLDLMPYRELTTPEALKAALQGGDRLLIDATERAYHRSQDDAKQREHYSGKKNSIRCRTRLCRCLTSLWSFLGGPLAVTITTTSC